MNSIRCQAEEIIQTEMIYWSTFRQDYNWI